MKRVSAQLPAAIVEKIDARRVGVPCTRSELLQYVLAEWVKGGAKFPAARIAAGETIASIPAHLRPGVMARARIVRDWRTARAKRRGRTVDDVTADYLAKLAKQGTLVSRRTLFNWDKLYRTKGAAGLIDGRRFLPLAGDGGTTAEPAQRRPGITRSQRNA